MNETQYCENCIHFSPLFTKGTCRRYAPTPLLDFSSIAKFYTIWPIVDPSDFCGEWKEIPPGDVLKSREELGKVILEKAGTETVVDDTATKAVVP